MAPTTPQNQGDVVASVRTQWSALHPGQRRTVLLAGGVVLTTVLVWAALAARGPTMAPLYTNLSLQDGAAIVTQLTQSKVPYKLANNGSTILVPQSEVDQLRLQLAGKGLPSHGSVGLSSVLNLPFGATSFTRQVAYQDALQGELEQTIDDIQGVTSSRVQIVIPQTSAFATATAPATASVLLNLQPGAQLSSNQVQGVVRLVAASVQGLSSKNVTVVNQAGQILWSQGIAGGSGTGTVQAGASQASQDLAVTQTFDQQLQDQLQQMLGQVFGPGNVVTHVQATLSFNKGTVNAVTYTPQKNGRGVVQKLQELKQSLTGGASVGGVTGTASNSFPTYTSTTGTGKSGTSSSQQLTEDFVINHQTTTTVTAPGSVSQLSVAVVVNGTLTPTQQQLVTSTVQAAVGYNATQKDQITVVGMPFNNSVVKTLKGQPGPLPLGVPRRLVYEGGAVAAALVAGLLVLLAMRRSAPASAGPAGEPALAAAGARGAVAAAAEDGDDDPLTALLSGARRSRERLQGSLRQQPEDVARVVRVWLNQDE